jgi:hypothetical protein
MAIQFQVRSQKVTRLAADIDQQTAERIDQLAGANRCSRAELLRAFVRHGLEAMGETA